MYFPDHDSGTFTALNTKAGGFGETTQLNYQLIKKSNGALEAVVRVKSSNTDKVMNEYAQAYGKYVTLKRLN